MILRADANMSIKEFLQKGMAPRLQSLLVAFFMMVTVQGMAQKNNSSGGSSAESRADLTVFSFSKLF